MFLVTDKSLRLFMAHLGRENNMECLLSKFRRRKAHIDATYHLFELPVSSIVADVRTCRSSHPQFRLHRLCSLRFTRGD